MYHHDYLCADDMGWGILFISFIKVIKFWHRDLTKTNDINWLLNYYLFLLLRRLPTICLLAFRKISVKSHYGPTIWFWSDLRQQFLWNFNLCSYTKVVFFSVDKTAIRNPTKVHAAWDLMPRYTKHGAWSLRKPI